MTSGAILSWVAPRSPSWASAFTEHATGWVAAQDGRQVRRFSAVDADPEHFGLYELEDLGQLTSAVGDDLRRQLEPGAVLDGCGEAVACAAAELVADSGVADREPTHLIMVAFPVPSEACAAFDDWYETEHTPLLLGAEDWLRVRRYRIVAGGRWSRIAVHDLASLEVLDSPARQASAAGPKRQLMARHAWYADPGRWLYAAVDTIAVSHT